MQLPIDSRLPEIVRHIERNTITLLEAEPGAGKTTRVPSALLHAGYPAVYVLEPRRLATRMAAKRVAEELNEPLGRRVGYQVRYEKVGDANTALWFLTEGVFTNRLLSGAPLPLYSAIILDEFHERHFESDLALALLRTLSRTRPDLRIVIMSATLAADLSAQLPDAPRIQIIGRMFPVDVRYTPSSGSLEAQVASAVGTIASSTEGHVLVFLPGVAEIRSALNACQSLASQSGLRLLPLYGDLDPVEQDLAVTRSTFRKVIFATNVAESSVTIDGVTAVVDSGLARIAAHSAWTGLSRLQISRISRASAIQRTGRAGRTAPGVAIRLFTEEEFVRRPETTPPEIVRADWSETMLRLNAAGHDPRQLPWLDKPPDANLNAAADLLNRLHAQEGERTVTPLGRRMAKLPVHPRIACLALKGAEFGAAGETARAAAWLADDAARLDRRDGHRYASDLDAILSADLSYTARKTQRLLHDASRSAARSPDRNALEKALLAAYPDRVASVRGDNLLLSNGVAARLDAASLARPGSLLVALEIDDRSEQEMPIVRLACAVQPDWLLDLFPERIEASEELRWNRGAERVEQVSLLRYERLVLDETVTARADSQQATDLLVAKALEAGLSRFADAGAVQRLFARVRFARKHGAQNQSEDEVLTQAFRQIAAGLSSFAELKGAGETGLLPALEAQLNTRLLDEIAPAYVRLPTGRRAEIEYVDDQPPVASARLQDFFGMRQTPKVAGGAVPLTVKLLAPNGRPVQITTDLLSFWKDLYPQVRRELSRRYPRHSWPETPG